MTTSDDRLDLEYLHDRLRAFVDQYPAPIQPRALPQGLLDTLCASIEERLSEPLLPGVHDLCEAEAAILRLHPDLAGSCGQMVSVLNQARTAAGIDLRRTELVPAVNRLAMFLRAVLDAQVPTVGVGAPKRRGRIPGDYRPVIAWMTGRTFRVMQQKKRVLAVAIAAELAHMRPHGVPRASASCIERRLKDLDVTWRGSGSRWVAHVGPRTA